MADPFNQNDPFYAGQSGYFWQPAGPGSPGAWVKAPTYSVNPWVGSDIQAESTGTSAEEFGRQTADLFSTGDSFRTAKEAALQPAPLQSGALDVTLGRRAGTKNSNPYSVDRANQARGAQQALLAQMAQQQAGPSLASMQGGRAQGQNLRAALAAGPGAMAQAGQNGAGLASSNASSGLGEQMRMSAGQGQLGGALRQGDIGVANDYTRSGLDTRNLNDIMNRFYDGVIQDKGNAKRKLDLESLRIKLAKERGQTDRDMQALNTALTTGATVVKAVI